MRPSSLLREITHKSKFKLVASIRRIFWGFLLIVAQGNFASFFLTCSQFSEIIVGAVTAMAMRSTKGKKRANTADATNPKKTAWKKPETTPTLKKPAAKGKKKAIPYYKYMTADEIRKAKDVELIAYFEYCDEKGGDYVKIGDNNTKLYRYSGRQQQHEADLV